MIGSNAVDFLNQLQELFLRYDLDINFIRGQAMDGCSIMSGIPGIRGGLQALVRKIRPSAWYVHCTAHCPNLVLANTASICIPVKSFVGQLESIYSFFAASPRKSSQLHSSQGSMGRKNKIPKGLSDTHWVVRANADMHMGALLQKINWMQGVYQMHRIF
eukprot:gene2627-3040_t